MRGDRIENVSEAVNTASMTLPEHFKIIPDPPKE